MRRFVKQCLTRLDAGEVDRLGRDVDIVFVHPHDRIARGGQIRRGRMILAKMRAAAVGAGLRRRADGAADLNEVFQVQPIGPGQVVTPITVRHAATPDRGTQIVERSGRPR